MLLICQIRYNLLSIQLEILSTRAETGKLPSKIVAADDTTEQAPALKRAESS